jgi:predicted membrane channel-forming protein YqfA (hemolysin III family)
MMEGVLNLNKRFFKMPVVLLMMAHAIIIGFDENLTILLLTYSANAIFTNLAKQRSHKIVNLLVYVGLGALSIFWLIQHQFFN